MNHYSLEFLQALSDWQRGGDQRQRKRRGEALRKQAFTIPDVHRVPPRLVFRQIALTGHYLRYLGSFFYLQESLGAWTKSQKIAEDFKGGVPSQGGDYTGVIFSTVPAEMEVVVDIDSLFAEEAFRDALAKNKNDITGYSQGTGRYLNTQREVILDVPKLHLGAAIAWGGHASSRDTLLIKAFGTPEIPNLGEEAVAAIEKILSEAGPKWVDPDKCYRDPRHTLVYYAELLGPPDKD